MTVLQGAYKNVSVDIGNGQPSDRSPNLERITSTLSRRPATLDTLPPHAQRGHSHYIIIPLTQGKFAMLDVEDADLGTYQWCMNSRYAARRESNKTLLMHRIVLERKLRRPIQENMMADHINGNPLDNRRSNLREVTLIQNQWNSKKQKNNTTQYIGVTNQDGYYIARIGGQKKILGSFKTALDASFCYDKAALEQRGEYALLNHPIEEVLAWQAPSHYLHSTNTSGYRGVTYVKSGRNWQASIWDGNKRLHLGLHTTAEEAARAYDRAAIELRGERAILNFPREEHENG